MCARRCCHLHLHLLLLHHLLRRRRLLLVPSLLLLLPPLLLALQLLVVGPRLPEEEPGAAAVAFSVMSIEPAGSPERRGAAAAAPPQTRNRHRHRPVKEEQEADVRGGAGEEEDDEEEGAYEDENELHSRQVGPRPLELQPWVADEPSFTAELSRIVAYIASPQLNCSRVLSPGQVQTSQPPAAVAAPRWLLCAEEWLLPAAGAPCVAYSFSMDGGDADFLKTALRLGCEVHSFDPSNSNASGGHLGNSLASNHGDGGVASQHKMWLEWRAPRKRRHKTRGNLGSVSKTLADIMAALGHHIVHFLYADLLSAEWRVFQNWIETGTLQNVHHVVAKVHLQWAGFEVGGTNEEVLRYWFSVLQGLRTSGLRLVHSSAGEGNSVLKQTVRNARSSYTLSWVNVRH